MGLLDVGYTFIDLDEAYKRFFKGLAKYPRFKKKGKSSNSFTLDASGKPIIIGGQRQHLDWVCRGNPGTALGHKFPFFNWLKTYEQLPICSTKKVTFSEQGGDWFISFVVEVDFLPTEKLVDRVGVDLGISNLATLSTEVIFENPKAYAKALKRLARLQRDLSRKVFQSHNWYKTKLKVLYRAVTDSLPSWFSRFLTHNSPLPKNNFSALKTITELPR